MDVRLPDLGAFTATIRFGQWLVDPCCEVSPEERLAEVLYSGVLIYLSAPSAGRFVRRELSPGAPLAPDAILGEITETTT